MAHKREKSERAKCLNPRTPNCILGTSPPTHTATVKVRHRSSLVWCSVLHFWSCVMPFTAACQSSKTTQGHHRSLSELMHFSALCHFLSFDPSLVSSPFFLLPLLLLLFLHCSLLFFSCVIFYHQDCKVIYPVGRLNQTACFSFPCWGCSKHPSHFYTYTHAQTHTHAYRYAHIVLCLFIFTPQKGWTTLRR